MMSLVSGYKPKMSSLLSFSKLRITNDTVVMVKADGEFNLFTYNRNGESYTLNRWNTKRVDTPCILALKEALDRQKSIQTVKLLLELYAVEDGKMLKLPQYIHEVKTGDPRKIRVGVFDLISINGNAIPNDYGWKLGEIERWLQDEKLCHVLPHITPRTIIDVSHFWDEWVVKKHYEGLVATVEGKQYKIKKHATVDAVIIGINKKPKLAEKQVTSIKYALMDENENFIELGDVASGIDHALRRKLYPLIEEYKIGEDNNTIFITPFIIIEVEFTETFEKERRIFTIENGELYLKTETRKFYSLRHPRLIQFRPDKTVNPTDLRLEQIAEETGYGV